MAHRLDEAAVLERLAVEAKVLTAAAAPVRPRHVAAQTANLVGAEELRLRPDPIRPLAVHLVEEDLEPRDQPDRRARAVGVHVDDLREVVASVRAARRRGFANVCLERFMGTRERFREAVAEVLEALVGVPDEALRLPVNEPRHGAAAEEEGEEAGGSGVSLSILVY